MTPQRTVMTVQSTVCPDVAYRAILIPAAFGVLNPVAVPTKAV
jgi:hypothetical protein